MTRRTTPTRVSTSFMDVSSCTWSAGLRPHRNGERFGSVYPDGASPGKGDATARFRMCVRQYRTLVGGIYTKRWYRSAARDTSCPSASHNHFEDDNADSPHACFHHLDRPARLERPC